MPSTFVSLYYHLIFSTKDRTPIIDGDWRERLHGYLGGTVRGLEGIPSAIGGTADHVHLLVGLSSSHRLADFMREVKKASSAWVHETIQEPRFAWQEGYGAFSVSATIRDRVRNYIEHQAEHHRNRTFREELEDFLRKAGVDYDERYLD